MSASAVRSTAIFIVEGSLLLAGLVYSASAAPDYAKDYLFAIAVVVVLFFTQKRHPLPTWLLIAGFVVLLLPPFGLTFDFFALHAFGIGYDKMLHFISGVILTLAAFHWLHDPHRRRLLPTILLAMLLVLGLSALNEINEFVGTKYLHISGPSMFSQGDSLPASLKNDLVVYDTWWDLIFDLFGTVAAACAVILIPGHLRKSRRRRITSMTHR